MVHLEDAQMRVRVAEAEGVEAGAEKDVLRNPVGLDRGRERLFREERTGDEEGAERGGADALWGAEIDGSLTA